MGETTPNPFANYRNPQQAFAGPGGEEIIAIKTEKLTASIHKSMLDHDAFTRFITLHEPLSIECDYTDMKHFKCFGSPEEELKFIAEAVFQGVDRAIKDVGVEMEVHTDYGHTPDKPNTVAVTFMAVDDGENDA